MKVDSVKYRKFILITSGSVTLMGIAVLFGWVCDVTILTTVVKGYPTMKFNAAIGFIFTGIALFLPAYKPGKRSIKLSRLLSSAVFLIGALSYLEEAVKIDLGIDQLFVLDYELLKQGHPYPGRMSPVSAICFCLMGLSVFSVNTGNNRLKKIAQGLFHAVTLISFIAALGFIFKVPTLYKLSYITSMALHTSLFFFFLSIAASIINPTLGLTGLFTGDELGNRMARKLFVQMTISILILTYIRILTHRFHFVSVEFGIVLFALSFILTSLFLILRSARALNLINTKKLEAETNLSRIRTFLDATPDPIIVSDSEGVIVIANNQIENVFGYTKEEVVGQKIEMLMPERYRSEYVGHAYGFFGGIEARTTGSGLELFALKKDGSEFPVEISSSPIALEDGRFFSVAIRDISKRKKIERELKESNERNKIFIQQSPNAIAMFDKEMRYMAASQKWRNDYNLSGKEILGHSHYEIFPEIGDDWKKIHQECMMGAINVCDESSFERADGSVQWITWDVRPWYVSEGEVGGILMYTADITQLKEKDSEKRRMEEILDKTNEVARIGAWEVNLKLGKIIWSRVTREIHEVDKDYEPDLTNAINFFKEGESRDKINTAVFSAIETGKPYDIEVQLITAKGNAVWARAIGQAEFEKGVCKRLYGVFQDISKVKKAELELNKLNEELETIFDAGHVSIISTDTKGLITRFNKGAELMLQYSASEMIGIHSPGIIHTKKEASERELELSELYSRPISGFDVFVHLAKEGKHESREWTYVRKDGSTFPVLLIVNALRNENQEITGFLGIATDITERVENQRKLEEAKLNLEELSDRLVNQNKQLAGFAQITSHNLRAPVSNLTSLLYLYKTSETEDEKSLMFGKFEMVVEHLTSTLNSLIDSIQIKEDVSKKLERIYFSEILKKSLEMLIAQINATGAVVQVDFSEAPVIDYHKIYIESIFLNLLTNAIKYRSPDRTLKIEIKTVLINDKVVLSVKDNGSGIDLKKHGHKLFGLHKTFHRHSEAKGIGLFITKAQIEAMGDTISAESQVNEGTTFKIEFNKKITNHE